MNYFLATLAQENEIEKGMGFCVDLSSTQQFIRERDDRLNRRGDTVFTGFVEIEGTFLNTQELAHLGSIEIMTFHKIYEEVLGGLHGMR